MKTAAVVCEYNPLHEGHIAMLGAVRERVGKDGRILCLMSGDFVQRGEPAIFDKRKRAASALEAGADLVLELPYPWSASVAEHFCAGAISILSRLHTDGIFFGSEKKTAEELKRIAQRIASKEFEERLVLLRGKEKTLSYPALVGRCYADCFKIPLDLLPNEILGAGYISEILRQKASLTFEALPILEGYSASEKRRELCEKNEKGIARLENAERAILCHLLLSGGNDRFSAAAAGCVSLEELFSLVRRKNDTDARLRRELLSVLLESAGKEKEEPEFTVLLAANERGRAFLAEERKNRELRIVTKPAHAPKGEKAEEQYALYLKAQRFYSCFLDEKERAADGERRSPVIR